MYADYGADWSQWPPEQVPLDVIQINISERPKPTPRQEPRGGGGSTSGAVGTPLPQEFANFGNLEAGANMIVPIENSDDLDVTEVELEVTENVRNAIVKVMKYETQPASVSVPESGGGATYAYMSINKFNFKDDALGKAGIGFKVKKSWLEDNNLDEDTVALQRYHEEEWQKLPTSKKSSTAIYVYYKAETPGFSIFSITANKNVEPEPEEPEIPIEEEPTAESGVEPESAEQEERTPTGLVTLKNSGKLGALIALSIVAGLLVVRFIKNRRPTDFV